MDNGNQAAKETEGPAYRYDGSTTFKDLLQAYFTATKTAPKDLADLLKTTEQTVDQWMSGGPTFALITNLRAAFERETGIDIDRWMVIDSKQRLLNAHPELADRVRFDRLTTREQVVDELRRYEKMYGGARYVAMQVGVAEKTLATWVNGNRVPTGDNLVKAIHAVGTGLIEGTRNDVVLRHMARAILGRELPDSCPGVTDMLTACVEFFRGFRGKSMSEIERMSEIPATSLESLYDISKDPDHCPYPKTVARILRTIVLRSHPTIGQLFDEAAEDYLAGRTVRCPVFSDTPAKEPVALAEEPPKAEPPLPAPVVSAASQGATLETKVERLTAALERALDMPTFRTEIGTTIDGVRHCLSAANLRLFPGETLPPEQLRLLKEAFTGLRKALVMVNGLSGEEKRRAYDVLAPEFDELALSLVSTKFWDAIGSSNLIEAQRESLVLTRKEKRK